LYNFLGLGVGTVVQGMEPAARQRAYSQPVLYCSNKELAFDYLRDRVALGQDQSALHLALKKLTGKNSHEQPLVMRGLHFGIVDEADSVFIDEARTPLILSSSQRNSEASEQCRKALFVASELVAGDDYQIDSRQRLIQLTAAGKERISGQSDALPGLWQSPRGREVLVTQALNALHLFQRDEHYVVSEGKVQIVDESTGRILPDRSWERGLHQMVEAKEGCELTDERKTLARITYQRLFRRYLRLAGMTGTAREVAPEIRKVYGLDVVTIPLNRPLQRTYWPTQVFPSKTEKWQSVVDQVKRVAGHAGRPVLIGTRSVKASEEISAVLTANNIEHALLNAKQDQFEAALVAMAGQPGRVTVATNMAGRGTDIALGPGIAALGGLHVILTEFHESLRIDRQLFGRCARQGDPGSCSVIVALEDEIFSVHAPYAAAVLRRWVAGGRSLPVPAIRFLRRLTQANAERKNARVRIQNLKQDTQLDQILAFSGSQS
jgi:preprotein translocase subunit SecA